MQTLISKILLLLVLLVPKTSLSQNTADLIAEADSLFLSKQYTQSFAIYDSLFSAKTYSDAMLLKMAFIQEGLGHPALCLYYLNLYHKTNDDRQVSAKMEELAQKHGLEGYESTDSFHIFHLLQMESLNITRALAALILLSLVGLIFQKRRNKNLVFPASSIAFFTFILFLFSNWGNGRSQAIISADKVYLMSGPSAGSTVIDILKGGHRLTIYGTKDVWLKVKWREKDAFVKQSSVLPLEI